MKNPSVALRSLGNTLCFRFEKEQESRKTSRLLAWSKCGKEKNGLLQIHLGPDSYVWVLKPMICYTIR